MIFGNPTNVQPVRQDDDVAQPLSPLTPGTSVHATQPVAGGSNGLVQDVVPAAADENAKEADKPATPAIVGHSPAAPSSVITPDQSTTAKSDLADGDEDKKGLASELPSAPAATDTKQSPADDDLLALKQQAIDQLSPLVSQLEQTPSEKFRTLMMMVQSTDNQALLKSAYAAAQNITDDKERAQALLDVVNEINYFTHKEKDEK